MPYIGSAPNFGMLNRRRDSSPWYSATPNGTKHYYTANDKQSRMNALNAARAEKGLGPVINKGKGKKKPVAPRRPGRITPAERYGRTGKFAPKKTKKRPRPQPVIPVMVDDSALAASSGSGWGRRRYY